ncbi:CLIP domain-containing serine protease B9-like [Pectinophora gossypiella]|uniref:CLIP domain-containing serine protease B9-like n=1 Tax=Pectinophora gossypiella TaxID=13191 RepID=UPI00214F2881|nr:CLIP domain-containing serine protease B9-like [Pectinophora gossypiella]
MFPLSLLFGFYFVQFSSAFFGTGGIFGHVLRYQKLCLCRCGVSGVTQFPDSFSNVRLLDGQSVSPHQFPWLASIKIDNRTIAGALISDKHVLTAASPLYGIPPNRVSVTLGLHDGCTRNPALSSSIETVILHSAYVSGYSYNDIALLRLRHVVPFSQFISPICMPDFRTLESDQVASTLSWKWAPNSVSCTPRVATLPILPVWTCLLNRNSDTITPNKGCLGPLGIKSIVCEDDVGAPVMSRQPYSSSFRLVGVVTTANCDHTSAPYYTKVAYHAAWIYEQIRDDCQCFSI